MLETNVVSDTEINELIDRALATIAAEYPWPISIVALGSDGASPAMNAGFHDLVVQWVLSKMWEREEYFDQSRIALEKYFVGIRNMKVFYSAGRT